MSFTIKKHSALPDNEYEIEGEIHPDIIKGFRQEALKELGLQIKIDGFRPGHIPENILVEKVGEMAITEESGQLALNKHYGDIMQKAIDEAKIKPLGSPAVTITKVAPGDAFGFKIKTALMPEVKIKDYAAIAKKTAISKAEIAVTDKEVDDAILDMQKQIAHVEWHKSNPDKKDHDHEGHDDAPLPEVNAEFIKRFGPFETVDAFREEIKKGIVAEKTRKEKEKSRLTIMEALLEKAEISLPKLLIESELNKMVNELSGNISQAGLTIEAYLKHINKTIEDIRKEWLPDAEKRAKTQLILSQIAIDEKITVTEAEVKKEVDEIMKYYKDADPERAAIYVETMLLNEKVWKWLEEQGK